MGVLVSTQLHAQNQLMTYDRGYGVPTVCFWCWMCVLCVECEDCVKKWEKCVVFVWKMWLKWGKTAKNSPYMWFLCGKMCLGVLLLVLKHPSCCFVTIILVIYPPCTISFLWNVSYLYLLLCILYIPYHFYSVSMVCTLRIQYGFYVIYLACTV